MPPQGGRKHPHQDFIQINTANILFICGGAFEGLDEDHREAPRQQRGLGFGAGDQQSQRGQDADELMTHVTHDDLLKYGLIPEFVGRLPVVVGLESLEQGRSGPHPDRAEERARAPVPAVLRARQRRAGLHAEDALEASAEEAIDHKTGARGLRTVLEDTLLDVMYEIPARTDVKKCVISGETIAHGQPPMLVTETEDAEPRRRSRGARAARDVQPEEESA